MVRAEGFEEGIKQDTIVVESGLGVPFGAEGLEE